MISINIDYKIKEADIQNISTHLNKCKDNFIPALDEKVNISEYSKKIVENSVTFEAWINNNLVGFIAAYFNDVNNYSGFITNVSVINEYAGKGLASQLLENCINYATEKKFREISLEVSVKNEPAIRLYRKYDFYEISYKNDLIIMKKNIRL